MDVSAVMRQQYVQVGDIVMPVKEDDAAETFTGFTFALPGMETGVNSDDLPSNTLSSGQIFTTNTMAGSLDAPLTTEQMRVYTATNILEYGTPKDDSIPLRFIVGKDEINKPPGGGPGEKDKSSKSVSKTATSKNINTGSGGKKTINAKERALTWKPLLEFSRKINWRHVLADDFIGDYKYKESIPFTIIDPTVGAMGNNLEWKTVIHYLLGMAYSLTPEYAIQFSLDSRRNNNNANNDNSTNDNTNNTGEEGDNVNTSSGFYGDPNTALNEHYKNVRADNYPIDPNFRSRLQYYLVTAYLAKFTQNPKAKQALLLTQDAVISKRGGPTGVLDIDIYPYVRNWIKASPKAIFKGYNSDGTFIIDNDFEELPEITSAQELNITSVDALVTNNIPTSLKNRYPNVVINTLPVAEYDCIVYLATGAYNLDLSSEGILMRDFGPPKFVKRNIYALERIAYNKNNNIMIAVQKNAVSSTADYIMFEGTVNSIVEGQAILETTKPKKKKSNKKSISNNEQEELEEEIPITIYLQEFQPHPNSPLDSIFSNLTYSIFIMAATQDNAVLDLLNQLRSNQ